MGKNVITAGMCVPVPGYIERFMAGVATKIGKTKEEVALFFLVRWAEHAHQAKRESETDNGEKKQRSRNGRCAK